MRGSIIVFVSSSVVITHEGVDIAQLLKHIETTGYVLEVRALEVLIQSMEHKTHTRIER